MKTFKKRLPKGWEPIKSINPVKTKVIIIFQFKILSYICLNACRSEGLLLGYEKQTFHDFYRILNFEDRVCNLNSESRV